MKNYLLITPESIEKMIKCFSDLEEELPTFLTEVLDVSEEICFLAQLAKRANQDAMTGIAIKQISILTLFVRHHMELIQQLINSIDAKKMTEEQIKNMREE